ncbi:hypothetical protein HDU76_009453, partial [Blyttiomyces sp. JEL0837]
MLGLIWGRKSTDSSVDTTQKKTIVSSDGSTHPTNNNAVETPPTDSISIDTATKSPNPPAPVSSTSAPTGPISTVQDNELIAASSTRSDPPPTLLVDSWAQGVSSVAEKARVSLATASAVSDVAFTGARWGTSVALGIVRSSLVSALNSARGSRAPTRTTQIEELAGDASAGQDNTVSAYSLVKAQRPDLFDPFHQIVDKYAEMGVGAVNHAFSLAELMTYGTWHLASSSVRFSFKAAEEVVDVINGVAGSTETSRTLAALVQLIREELTHGTDPESANKGSTGIIGRTIETIALMGGLTKAITAYACLQMMTERRTMENRKVMLLFEGVATVDVLPIDGSKPTMIGGLPGSSSASVGLGGRQSAQNGGSVVGAGNLLGASGSSNDGGGMEEFTRDALIRWRQSDSEVRFDEEELESEDGDTNEGLVQLEEGGNGLVMDNNNVGGEKRSSPDRYSDEDDVPYEEAKTFIVQNHVQGDEVQEITDVRDFIQGVEPLKVPDVGNATIIINDHYGRNDGMVIGDILHELDDMPDFIFDHENGGQNLPVISDSPLSTLPRGEVDFEDVYEANVDANGNVTINPNMTVDNASFMTAHLNEQDLMMEFVARDFASKPLSDLQMVITTSLGGSLASSTSSLRHPRSLYGNQSQFQYPPHHINQTSYPYNHNYHGRQYGAVVGSNGLRGIPLMSRGSDMWSTNTPGSTLGRSRKIEEDRDAVSVNSFQTAYSRLDGGSVVVGNISGDQDQGMSVDENYDESSESNMWMAEEAQLEIPIEDLLTDVTVTYSGGGGGGVKREETPVDAATEIEVEDDVDELSVQGEPDIQGQNQLSDIATAEVDADLTQRPVRLQVPDAEMKGQDADLTQRPVVTPQAPVAEIEDQKNGSTSATTATPGLVSSIWNIVFSSFNSPKAVSSTVTPEVIVEAKVRDSANESMENRPQSPASDTSLNQQVNDGPGTPKPRRLKMLRHDSDSTANSRGRKESSDGSLTLVGGGKSTSTSTDIDIWGEHYPLPSLIQNMLRYCRFSSAAYGKDFLTVLRMGKVRDLQTTDPRIPANHYALAIHVGIPVNDILYSTFVSENTPKTSAKLHPVVHYVSLDRAARVVVVTMRGTLSLSDLLVDMKFDYSEYKGNKVHAGMLKSAMELARKDSELFGVVKQALKDNPTFGLILTGHSLGSAVASLVAMEWSVPAPKPTSTPPRRTRYPTSFVTSEQSGLPPNRPIHCYAYGAPCVADINLSESAKGLVSSVVNGDDIVSTLSLGLVRDLKHVTMHMLDPVNKGLSERIIGRSLGMGIGVSGLTGFVSGPSGKKAGDETKVGDGSGDGGDGEISEEEFFWDVMTRLRTSMKNQRLYPLGVAYWINLASTVTQDSVTKKRSSTSRVTLHRCEDVREMFKEPRFSAKMMSDHTPMCYE